MLELFNKEKPNVYAKLSIKTIGQLKIKYDLLISSWLRWRMKTPLTEIKHPGHMSQHRVVLVSSYNKKTSSNKLINHSIVTRTLATWQQGQRNTNRQAEKNSKTKLSQELVKPQAWKLELQRCDSVHVEWSHPLEMLFASPGLHRLALPLQWWEQSRKNAGLILSWN